MSPEPWLNCLTTSQTHCSARLRGEQLKIGDRQVSSTSTVLCGMLLALFSKTLLWSSTKELLTWSIFLIALWLYSVSKRITDFCLRIYHALVKNESILFGLVDQFDGLVGRVTFKMIWVVNPNDTPLFPGILPGSPLNQEFVQVEGMHELNVSPPSLQNNVTIVGTSELTTEVQIALENLFESKTL